MAIFRRILSKIFREDVGERPEHKEDYKNEESWIPGGEIEEKTKIPVTPEELGEVLCGFSYNISSKYLNNKETLELLGIGEKSKNILLENYYFEIISILFFLVMLQIDNLLKNENIKNRILDSMHEAYYKLIDLNEAGVVSTKEHFSTKYKEYLNASKEKRGPNWLWPLSNCVINNLRHKKTKDGIAMMELGSFLSKYIDAVSDLIENKYAIALEKK